MREKIAVYLNSLIPYKPNKNWNNMHIPKESTRKPKYFALFPLCKAVDNRRKEKLINNKTVKLSKR